MCRNILVVAKENSSNIYYITTRSGYDTNNTQSIPTYGDTLCQKYPQRCLRNLSLDDIYEMCTKHIGSNLVEFKIVWKI